MVQLTRDRQIVNRDKLFDLIGNNGINQCRIRSKFLEDVDYEIKKESDNEKFLSEIQDKLIEAAEKLPHRQIVLKIKKEDMSIDVVLNPVTGAA